MGGRHRCAGVLTVSWYERRLFFERLCVLRSRYSRRGLDDRRSAMSIRDAIAFAERRLGAQAQAEQPPSVA